MLFNSIEFLFVFFPVTFGVFYLVVRIGREKIILSWLILASLFFYGWWNPIYVLLLLSSILVNFLIGKRLIQIPSGGESDKVWKKPLLITGLIFNLGLLCYFKYINFVLDSFASITGQQFSVIQVILPLAISFFTFQQIAFLVDAYRGKLEKLEFLRYCFFVSFFPQLIAGPIVHHSEIFPQLRKPATFRINPEDVSIGLSQFSIGLFKKIIIADSLASIADPVFASTSAEIGLTSLDYMVGVIAFSLQIYFDFSAYSDMALGLARMFTIRLPDNFNSPYKATNIIDFWRNWHMTLSRFLKDYLYISLGGNRKGRTRRYINLFITMTLGGLWHGANWHFVFWGFLHGAYLSANHMWRRINPLTNGFSGKLSRVKYLTGIIVSHVITLIAIAIAWIFFRAETMSNAWNILVNVIVFNEVEFSAAFQFILSGSFLGQFLGDSAGVWLIMYLVLLIAWVLWLPNCQQLFAIDKRVSIVSWQPSGRWAVAVAATLFVSIVGLGRVNEFIYFQF